MPSERKRKSRNLRPSVDVMHQLIVLAPSFENFGPNERGKWHADHIDKLVGPAANMSLAEAQRLHGEPSVVRARGSGDLQKPALLVPPSERKGTEVWFVHKRHRVVFVVDTSPSMRTMRGVDGASPFSAVASALAGCFHGLARPMGSLHQEVSFSDCCHDD